MPKGKSTKLITVIDDDAGKNGETDAQENELLDFLDGLGPQGIAEVSLYRCLANGKQRFIVSGPPAQFSESYVQTTYGGGDYMVRSRLNGRWYRSKMFSVEAPGGEPANPGAGLVNGELERLKLRLQEQELRLETDRASREQRAHELQLALIENRSAAGGTSIADIITAVKSLREMGSGQDEIYKSIDRALGLANRFRELQNGGSSGAATEGGWWDWLKPIAAEAGRAVLPKVLPFLNNGAPPPGVAIGMTPATSAPPAAAAIAAPAPDPQPAPATNETPGNDQAEYLAQKKDALLFALAMARMNRPAELYVDLAIEKVEASGDPLTARFMSEMMAAESFEKWFAELQTLEPTVITQRGWFELFFNAMRETLNAKATESAQPDA